jgi:hypothetical protein
LRTNRLNTDADSDRDSHAHAYTDTYPMHGQMFTDAQTAPYGGTSAQSLTLH